MNAQLHGDILHTKAGTIWMPLFQVTTYRMLANNVNTASDHVPVFIIELTTEWQWIGSRPLSPFNGHSQKSSFYHQLFRNSKYLPFISTSPLQLILCSCQQVAWGSVVGWGTMLQAGRSPVRVPDKVDFSIYLILPGETMALGSTQPLIEISTRKFLGDKGGRRIGLTTLSPSVSRMSENVGASTSRNPKGLHGLYRDILRL
jgi:hypothetical protein